MFGYIKPCKPELKIKEYETYKAVYCGLCHALGKRYPFFMRYTLSYDFTFLALMFSSLNAKEPQFTKTRCPVNPLVKVNINTEKQSADFSADLAMIMIYFKACDNIDDSGFLKKGLYYFLKFIMHGGYKKAKQNRPLLERIVSEMMIKQRAAEKNASPEIDKACLPTAEALSRITQSLAEDENDRRVLSRMGYMLGRFIYLCDAFDDIEDDLKHGNFNPFILKYNLTKKSSLKEAYDYAKEALYLTSSEIQKAYDLLDMHYFKTITDNIVYLGLNFTVDEILSKKEKAVI